MAYKLLVISYILIGSLGDKVKDGLLKSFKINGLAYGTLLPGGLPMHYDEPIKIEKRRCPLKFFISLFFIMCFLQGEAQAQLLKDKILIGRVEWVEMPDLKIKHKARIDTGAKTTSLHAVNIEEVEQRGELFVKFQTVDNEGKTVEVVRKVDATQKVSNTAGHVSKRYVIKEKIKIGPVEREILINLNNRTNMDYKFLVGRNLLLGRFIVDVARSHVLGD